MDKKDYSTIFYGAGKYARENLSRWISEGLEPICFVDIDEKKHYNFLSGSDSNGGKNYKILPLAEAIAMHPDYHIYLTLAHENLFDVTEWLIEHGIPRERIKYVDSLEYRKGCNLLGGYLQFRANYFYACCSQYYREKIPRQATVKEDIEKHRKYCTGLIERFRNEQFGSCEGCPELKDGIWDKEPKLWCVQLATGFEEVRCNLKCSYCADSEYLKDYASNNMHTVSETLVQLIHCELDDTEIELAAGEITVSPYRETVIRIIKESKRSVQIFTNASVYDPCIAEIMREGLAGLVVSVDAGTKETFSKIKGVDCFGKVVQNLERYALTGGKLELKYIIMTGVNDNESDIDGFACLAVKLQSTVCVSADSLSTGERLCDKTLKILLRLIKKIRRENLPIVVFRENFNPDDLNHIDKSLCE